MVEAPESKLVSDTGESPAQGKLRSETVCHAMHFNASKNVPNVSPRFASNKCICAQFPFEGIMNKL